MEVDSTFEQSENVIARTLFCGEFKQLLLAYSEGCALHNTTITGSNFISLSSAYAHCTNGQSLHADDIFSEHAANSCYHSNIHGIDCRLG